MKRIYLYILIACGLSSCTDTVQDALVDGESNIKNALLSHENFVKYSDIETLTNCDASITRGATTQKVEIKCLTNKTKDTLLYVCKKADGGWTMYSSDTRVPAIVAQSGEGSFDTLMQNESAKLWIQSILDDMYTIRSLSDDKLNFSKEQIENNKDFWKSISMPDEYVKEKLSEPVTRVSPDIQFLGGQYVLRLSDTYTEVYDSVPRMTTTNWNQNYPYNSSCPERSVDDGNAPAGCVAIAGAQMLYFLHYKLGVPEEAPSTATCEGDVNYHHNCSQTNYNSTIWDQMTSNGYYSAPLIANVGHRIGMHYGNYSSGAFTEDLVNCVFVPYGISCTYQEFNTDIVKQSLANGFPVLLDAFSVRETSNEFEKVGHAFITDRYKRCRFVTVNHYEWRYTNPNQNAPLPFVPEKVEYVYSSPFINMIGMNWGWGSGCNIESEWFTLTGDWISSREPSHKNWNINRRMIHGFQAI